MIDEQRQELQAAKQAADEQIDTGQGQIDAGWDELTQGRTELARQKALGEAQLELAQERLDMAKEQIDAIDDPQWYVLTGNRNILIWIMEAWPTAWKALRKCFLFSSSLLRPLYA